jgi:hypothetical protein
MEVMVPGRGANEETFSQLGYLLSGDDELTERLVRLAVVQVCRAGPRGSPPVETLVREWLEDPGDGYRADTDVPIRQALGALPPPQRAAVVLRHWSGLPEAEVARIVGCSEADVASLGEWPRDALRTLAADAPPVVVPADEVAQVVRDQRRHRLRSVTVAAVVLTAAGVLATTLSVGSPASAPEAEVAPTPWTSARAVPVAPDMGAVVIDDQARELTAQLADAVDEVLPELANVRAGPSGPLTGFTERAPLEFYTRARSQETYLAQAIFDADGESALLLLEVRRLTAVSGWSPCPRRGQECAFREYPDQTRADVVGYVEAGSRNVVRSLTSLRPDGTFVHVTVYGVELPLSVTELFQFAQVFSF